MATVPNYYYQSPWIAEAGKNLAMALAPQDPEKALAAQKLRAEIAMAEQKSQYDAEDRTRGQKAQGGMAKIAKIQAEPPRNPITNEIDFEEARKQTLASLADVFENGPINMAGPAMEASGPFSPTYDVDKELANVRGGIQSNQIAQRGDQAMQLAGFIQDAIGNRQESAFAHDREMNAAEFEQKMQLLTAQQAGAIDQINARLKGGGGKGTPLTVAGTVVTDITRLMYQQMKQSGIEVTPKNFTRLVVEAGVKSQQGRNIPQAVVDAWNENVTDETTTVQPKGMTSFLRSPKQYWKTKFDQQTNPNPDATSLGDPATATPAPREMSSAIPGEPGPAPAAPAAAAAPAPTARVVAPAGGLPPAALARLKEGVVTTFGNGQQWTLKNGQPVRVK